MKNVAHHALLLLVALASPAWAAPEEVVLGTVFDPDMMSYVVDAHNIYRPEGADALGCTYWMPVLAEELAWVTLRFTFADPVDVAELHTGVCCFWPQVPSEAWLSVGPSLERMTLIGHVTTPPYGAPDNASCASEPTDVSDLVRGSREVFVKAELWQGYFPDTDPYHVQFMRQCAGPSDALRLTVETASAVPVESATWGRVKALHR